MSLLKASLVALCATLLLVSRMAFALVEIPPLQARVTDLTGTLSESDKSNLEAKLKAFEAQKGAQIALLMLPTTQPEDIAQFGIRLAETWQIGRDKSDDGVIVIVAKDDKKMRIEVGYGLEGAIPDLYAKRIISEHVAPYFKQGDFAGGLYAAVDRLTKLIEGEALPAPSSQKSGVSENLGFLLVTTLIVAVFFQAIFGRLFGSAVTGGTMGGLATMLGSSMLFWGLGAFIFAMLMPWLFGSGSSRSYQRHGGYYGNGGSSGGGWSSSDSWSGGGGDFGGGGASGDW